MTKRKHNYSSVICGGCGREFGIIQHSHIVKCDGLIKLGIKTRGDYKKVFGQTMSDDALVASMSNIKGFNNSLTSEERSKHAFDARMVFEKLGNSKELCSIGGKRGSKTLWEKEGQKDRHCLRMKRQNAAGSMKQKPNKLEYAFWDMIGKDRLEYASFLFWKTIVSDGEIKHITPDFRVPGTLRLIEVFGDYWHKNDDPQDRINLWESVGCECIVVWEHEINKQDKSMIKKVEEFISGNLHECPAPTVDLVG
jgi:very-short-patch-repair endonuclease